MLPKVEIPISPTPPMSAPRRALPAGRPGVVSVRPSETYPQSHRASGPQRTGVVHSTHSCRTQLNKLLTARGGMHAINGGSAMGRPVSCELRPPSLANMTFLLRLPSTQLRHAATALGRRAPRHCCLPSNASGATAMAKELPRPRHASRRVPSTPTREAQSQVPCSWLRRSARQHPCPRRGPRCSLRRR